MGTLDAHRVTEEKGVWGYFSASPPHVYKFVWKIKLKQQIRIRQRRVTPICHIHSSTRNADLITHHSADLKNHLEQSAKRYSSVAAKGGLETVYILHMYILIYACV